MDDDYKQEWLAEQHEAEDEARVAYPVGRGVIHPKTLDKLVADLMDKTRAEKHLKWLGMIDDAVNILAH